MFSNRIISAGLWPICSPKLVFMTYLWVILEGELYWNILYTAQPRWAYSLASVSWHLILLFGFLSCLNRCQSKRQHFSRSPQHNFVHTSTGTDFKAVEGVSHKAERIIGLPATPNDFHIFWAHSVICKHNIHDSNHRNPSGRTRPMVYSASNRYEYQKQVKKVSAE
jgi:ABC-type nickel/cobalt efflux system permease component RcnA